jgi:hypothetical protein
MLKYFLKVVGIFRIQLPVFMTAVKSFEKIQGETSFTVDPHFLR